MGRSGFACAPAVGRAEAPSARLLLARLKPCPSEFSDRMDGTSGRPFLFQAWFLRLPLLVHTYLQKRAQVFILHTRSRMVSVTRLLDTLQLRPLPLLSRSYLRRRSG